MTSLLLQIGATKLAVSVVLAAAVWMVHRRVDRPAVSYPLWLMVLVILLVPAVVSLPVLPEEGVAAPPAPGVALAEPGVAPIAPGSVLATPGSGAPGAEFGAAASDAEAGSRLGTFLQPALAILWFAGTAGLLGWTAVRTIRFRRTLKQAVRPAPSWLHRQAAEVGRDLGLSRIPQLCTTSARVTPMVWWSGRVRMLIPSFLLTDPGSEELRAILAHELAHVRRRDHLVRWLEWLACSVFWWNPVAWWARHQLRIAEESCCDQLAVAAGRSCPRIYARALLSVVANASAASGFRPPLPASAADGFGRATVLERRIRMIVSAGTRSPAPRWLRAASRLAVASMLPLGLIYCSHYRPTQAEAETALDPVVGAALDRIDDPSAAADETAEAACLLSRGDAKYRDIIREAVETGALSERRGRQLNRWLCDGDTSAVIARADLISLVELRSPEVKAHFEEMKHLLIEIGRNPDWDEGIAEWSRLSRELPDKMLVALARQ